MVLSGRRPPLRKEQTLSLETKMCGLVIQEPGAGRLRGHHRMGLPGGKMAEEPAWAESWPRASRTDPKLRSSVRPTFYPLSKYGLKGAMVAAEFLSHYEPEVWAREVAPRFRELCD